MSSASVFLFCSAVGTNGSVKLSGNNCRPVLNCGQLVRSWHAVAMEMKAVHDACFVKDKQKPEIQKPTAAAASFTDLQQRLSHSFITET